MTGLDLDAIEARVNAATPGPWITGVRWEDPCDVYWVPINRPGSDPDNPHQPDRIALIRYETCGFQYPHYEALSDAAFIAHARTDVPALVAEVRRLRAEREHMELNPTGTVDWLKNRVNELTAERDQLTAYNRAVKGANADLRAELNETRRHLGEAVDVLTNLGWSADADRLAAALNQETPK